MPRGNPQNPTVRVPRLPFEWLQGEHMAITGRTGTGKTTLCAVLLAARKNTLALRSKADKAPIPGKLIRKAAEFERARIDKEKPNRFLLDPEYKTQYASFAVALERAWKDGGWCIYFDELFYLTRLGLTPYVERALTQGRSKGLTVMSGTQRPNNITRFALSEVTHLLSFRCDRRDQKILGEIGGDKFQLAVSQLKRFQFAWLHVPTEEIWTGRVQELLADPA